MDCPLETPRELRWLHRSHSHPVTPWGSEPVFRVREEPEEQIWCFILEQCPCPVCFPLPCSRMTCMMCLYPFLLTGSWKIWDRSSSISMQTLQRVLLGKWGEAGRPGRGHVQGSVGSCPRTSRNLLSPH